MGKPFSKELGKLQTTYCWVRDQNIEQISIALRSFYHLPLLSVGSGGSLSAAEFHAAMHRNYFRSVSMAVTPIELVSALPGNGKASVWFFSASGNNIDIRRSFQHAALCEPRTICALVGRSSSKLAELSKKYQYSNVFEFPLPSGKDGFLATNSLLAFCVIVYRIYRLATNQVENLPNTLEDIFSRSIKNFKSLAVLESHSSQLWKQRTLHIVYSPKLKSAAIDIESKFIEAGLGSVHLADIRNFAHGRHHWFAKNQYDCGVLCLSTNTDGALAKKTLDLMPDEIPKFQIDFSDSDGLEMIAGMLLSFYITLWRGAIFNIDPGRPGVPGFGSKIYRLSEKSGFISSVSKEKAAISRKTLHGPIEEGIHEKWRKAYRKFTKNLSKQYFSGLILDYDGTIVDGRYRTLPPSKKICDELNRLLEGGVKIGFATGRGKSIRAALQSEGAIKREYWDKVIIGYYNGSYIGFLSDKNSPESTDESCTDLEGIKKALLRNLLISDLSLNITERNSQITVESSIAVPEMFLWESVKDQLYSTENSEVNIVRSSHSIDILASHVTKLAVLDKMSSFDNSEDPILAIGDRGRWPGNDSKLLGVKFSLSVDEVSFAEDRCWNLCPAGVRGPQGALEYLKRLKCEDGRMKFK